MDSWAVLFDVVLLLSAALVLGGVFSKLGQSPLVGYLLAGMFLGGPGSLGAIRSPHQIELIAELGVSLLLFSLGLEFSFQRFLSLGSRSLGAGIAQILITWGAVAFGVRAFGLSPLESTTVGALVALSSTAAALRVLMEEGATDTVYGRDAIAILLVQDIAIVPLALLFSVLGDGAGAGEVLQRSGRILLLALGFMVGLYLLINLLGVRALRALADRSNRELAVLLAVVSGLGAAWAAHEAGISPALGAFAAGMFLGGSPFAVQIRADISSLRVVLLTLFFVSAGIVADPRWMLAHAPLVFGLFFVLVLTKTTVTVLALRLFGRPLATSAATALALAQIGEFAFVLGAIARDRQILSPEIFNLIVSCTIASLLATPYLVRLAPRLARYISERSGGENPAARAQKGETPDVVLIGYGPAGRLAAEAVTQAGLRLGVIDMNGASVEEALKHGYLAVVGDAAHPEVLEKLHVAAAKVVVITVPDSNAAAHIAEHVREAAPRAHLIVRLRHERHRSRMRSAGSDIIVGDEQEVGAALAQRILEVG